MFEKAGMLGKVVVLAVFKHKESTRSQHLSTQHPFGQFHQFG